MNITMTTNSSLRNSSLFDSNSTGFPPTENISSKDDKHDEMYQGFFDPKADVPAIVLAVLIVTVNSLVLVLMARKRYLRSITNLLLCGLAVSDLLTGLVSVPLFITCGIMRQPAICISEESMARFISASIVCHLMAVTTDRYLAIIHPLRYSTLVTRPRCILAILFIWLFSAVTSLVQLTWLCTIHDDPEEDLSADFKRKELIYDINFLTLFFFVPAAFMLFSYVRIVLEIARQSRNIRQQNISSLHLGRNRIRHEWKAVAIFAAMMLVYIICWLPFFSLRRFDMHKLPIPLLFTVNWLRCLASFLNPCMYIFGKKDFRKAVFEHAQPIKLELNLTSTSKAAILKATLATSGGKGDKIRMKSFARIGSRKIRNSYKTTA